MLGSKTIYQSAGSGIGVDRETNTIKGYVVAQVGDLKSGYGRFDESNLFRMISLWPKAGLRSRFGRPNPMSGNDGLGRFLGRAVNPRLAGNKLRADLVLNQTCFSSPAGNLGEWLLTLAETDPEAISSSLALKCDRIFDLDANGRKKTDSRGKEMLPLIIPKRLHATDIVEEGDATSGLLSKPVPRSFKDMERELRHLEMRGRQLQRETPTAAPGGERSVAARRRELDQIKARWN